MSEKLEFAVRAPELRVPLEATVPLQAPEALQDVAFVELHVRLAVPPVATVVGFAVSVAVGATLTVTVATVLEPPAPVQVSENDVAAVSALELWLPLVASVPLQPPEAVHDVAFEELHVSVAVSPLLTTVLDALIDAAGGAGGELEEPPHATNSKATVAIAALEHRMAPLSLVVA